jgi:hypothetical protein
LEANVRNMTSFSDFASLDLFFFKMNQATTSIPLEGLNGVKSQRKSRLYPCFVIARMDLFCNRKNEPVLKILNIMILLSFEYNF